MARYLVMKRDNDIGVVKEEQSQLASLSLGNFIEELASPHYERYKIRSIDFWDVAWDVDENKVKSFERLWDFCDYSIVDFERLFSSLNSYEGAVLD